MLLLLNEHNMLRSMPSKATWVHLYLSRSSGNLTAPNNPVKSGPTYDVAHSNAYITSLDITLYLGLTSDLESLYADRTFEALLLLG